MFGRHQIKKIFTDEFCEWGKAGRKWPRDCILLAAPSSNPWRLQTWRGLAGGRTGRIKIGGRLKNISHTGFGCTFLNGTSADDIQTNGEQYDEPESSTSNTIGHAV